MPKTILIFFHTFIIFFGFSCNLLKEDSSGTSDSSLLLLANAATTISNCEEFSSSESACIVNPDLVTTTCSEAEKKRLISFINPKASRTNDALEGFFACWSRCNLVFNSKDTICGSTKYFDTSEYHISQRAFSTAASKEWGNCMDKCNGGSSNEGDLQGITFSGYGY